MFHLKEKKKDIFYRMFVSNFIENNVSLTKTLNSFDSRKFLKTFMM